MRLLTRQIILFSLALAGVASIGRSQVLTFDTNTGFDATTAYGTGFALADGSGYTQTFTNITSFDFVTVRLIAEDSASFVGNTMQTYFSAWTGNDASGPITTLTPSIIFDSTSWMTSGDGYLYFDAAINLASVGTLPPATTYGLTLVGNAFTDSNGIKIAAATVPYADGQAYLHGPVSIDTDLYAGGANFGGSDLAFTATDLSPVPEASTITVLFAGLFAAGMVGIQLRKRRQLAAAAAQA